MALKTAVLLSIARAVATDTHMIESYFDKLEDTLEENGIFNKASHIFNCDETGFCLSTKPPKVISTVRMRDVSHVTKIQITVMACTSASDMQSPFCHI